MRSQLAQQLVHGFRVFRNAVQPLRALPTIFPDTRLVSRWSVSGPANTQVSIVPLHSRLKSAPVYQREPSAASPKEVRGGFPLLLRITGMSIRLEQAQTVLPMPGCQPQSPAQR